MPARTKSTANRKIWMRSSSFMSSPQRASYCHDLTGRKQLKGESGLRLGFLQQHDIGIGVAADQAQFAAVEGPVKVYDLFRFEVGDLFSRRTVERLQPKVFRVLIR